MTTAVEAPAIKSYFFGKGYRDLAATIQRSWQLNLAEASLELGKGTRALQAKDLERFKAAWHYAAAVSVFLFGTGVFLTASAVHIMVLLFVFGTIYLLFSMVYVSERVWLFFKGFVTSCPECHERMPLPEYACPSCPRIHRRLVPGSYGILKHTCRCGERLPATFFMNRGKLQAQCPSCSHRLAREHSETRHLYVAIMGGPSVGKSAYLMNLVRSLVEQRFPARGWSHGFVDKRHEAELDVVAKGLRQGRVPDKTLSTLPHAFNLLVTRGDGRSRTLYLYDPAGEAYTDTANLAEHRFHDYLSGLLLLVDPFAIPSVRREYELEIAEAGQALKPSTHDPVETVERLVMSLEGQFGHKKTRRIDIPVAVVINKVDAFDLERRVGQAALDVAQQASPDQPEAALRDELITTWLRGHELAPLLQLLETRFTTVRFFTASALGHMPDGSPRDLTGSRVVEPALWLAAQADKRFGWREG